jgi:hypothetical protein
LLHLLLPFVEVKGEILRDVLSIPRPVDESPGLLLAVAQSLDDVELFLQVAALARELLSPGLVRPDPRVGELLFYFGE